MVDGILIQSQIRNSYLDPRFREDDGFICTLG